jgi:hypothetical protein
MAKLSKSKRPDIKFQPITLDGKEYKLAYDFNAICQAEDLLKVKTGQEYNLLAGVATVFNDLWDAKRPGANILRGLLWACLSVAHPTMTLEDAGDLIQIPVITDLVAAIKIAYAISFEVPNEEEVPKNVEAAESETAAGN